MTIAKGSIPAPEKYMDEIYIADHLQKFKKEGGAFIVVKGWIEGGNPDFKTLPPRKFVGLKSDMDEIIKKYKSRNNDWTVIRDDLNLGIDANLEGEEIYYVTINPNDGRFQYDIPNGNEGNPYPKAGAIVGEWVPGGHTKNGIKEAVVIGSENIIHNKKIENLLTNFNGQWIKIQ